MSSQTSEDVVDQTSENVEDFCTNLNQRQEPSLSVERESASNCSKRWNPLSSSQHHQEEQQQQLYLSLDAKNVKSLCMDSIQAKAPAYLPSATARRAEEMLSSLGGESIELTSTSPSKETSKKNKEDSENRKRKLMPKYDLDEISNVLGCVADEFKDVFAGGQPGYPLTSMFGMDQLTPKMIRFEFDAKDDDKSNHSTVKRRRVETLPNNNNDIDEITRRASYVNDTRESQQSDCEDKSSKGKVENEIEIEDVEIEAKSSNAIGPEVRDGKQNEEIVFVGGLSKENEERKSLRSDLSDEEKHASSDVFDKVEKENRFSVEKDERFSSDVLKRKDESLSCDVLEGENCISSNVLEQEGRFSSDVIEEKEERRLSCDVLEANDESFSSEVFRRSKLGRCRRRHCRHRCKKRQRENRRKKFKVSNSEEENCAENEAEEVNFVV